MKRGTLRKLGIRPGSFGIAVACLGLLLWARLLLLTGHPKIAIAAPDAPQAPAAKAATSKPQVAPHADPAQQKH